MAEMDLTYEVEGSGFTKDITEAMLKFKPELLGVITEEGEEIIAASKEIVPVDSADLKKSGGLYGSEETSEGVFIRLGYGGAATAYAKDQHETPPNVYSHSEGQSWKYLETPFYDAVQSMGPRLASRLAARLAGTFGGGGGGASGDSGATFGDGGE